MGKIFEKIIEILNLNHLKSPVNFKSKLLNHLQILSFKIVKFLKLIFFLFFFFNGIQDTCLVRFEI